MSQKWEGLIKMHNLTDKADPNSMAQAREGFIEYNMESQSFDISFYLSAKSDQFEYNVRNSLINSMLQDLKKFPV
jgi:hypothetical protein